jgi:hypothetical protein
MCKNWKFILRLDFPQETNAAKNWLGPYVFLTLINDLNTIIVASLKYVDDVTLTKIINHSDISSVQLAADQVAELYSPILIA